MEGEKLETYHSLGAIHVHFKVHGHINTNDKV